MKKVWRDPYFLAGFLFLTGLFVFSLYHHFVLDNHIPEQQLRYDANGTPTDKAPFGPSAGNWFGTDQFGLDLFYMLISGAKYTLGFAIIIGLFRLVFSFFWRIIFVVH